MHHLYTNTRFMYHYHLAGQTGAQVKLEQLEPELLTGYSSAVYAAIIDEPAAEALSHVALIQVPPR